jgi:hypothetical protein
MPISGEHFHCGGGSGAAQPPPKHPFLLRCVAKQRSAAEKEAIKRSWYQ